MSERRLLVDNSVYARRSHPEIRPVWTEGVIAQRLVTTDAFLLEALYSARSGPELRAVRTNLATAMDHVPCVQETWEIAFAMQEVMADAAGLMHRRKPLDFLIAATAHQHGLGVLHYDRDYDLIAEHGGHAFASVWAVPQGSLGS